MTDKEKKQISQYGYQPKGENRGHQPSKNKPQNNHAESKIKSNGNVAQNK